MGLTGAALAGTGFGWVFEHRQRQALAKAADAEQLERIARSVVAWIVPRFSKFQRVLIEEGWFSQATPCMVIQSQLSYPISGWSVSAEGAADEQVWDFSSKEHGPIPPIGARLVFSTPALGSDAVRNIVLQFADPSGRAIVVKW